MTYRSLTWRCRDWREAGILAVAFLYFLLAVFPVRSAVDPRLGDLDQNGQLTISDYSLLLNHFNATNSRANYLPAPAQLPEPLLPFADVTGDGVIDTSDLHHLVDGILGDALTPRPRPIEFFPTNGAFPDVVDFLYVRFNQGLLPSGFTTNSLVLRYSGSNAVLEAETNLTSDDILITFGTLSYQATNRIVWTFDSLLPVGAYRATIRPPVVSAEGGRTLNRSYSWEFKTLGGRDTDGDGIPDEIEKDLAGYLTNNPISFPGGIRDGDRDYDGDDFGNSNEVFRATDIRNWDTDGDGWADGVEVADGKDPRNISSHPEWSIVARPPVEIASLDGETLGIGNFGTIVARPPIQITLPGADEALGTNNFGIVVARPPVEITLPGADEVLGTNNLGTIVALPPVTMTNKLVSAPTLK